MFAYISWYTVALLWIFRMEKKMRKMQCYTEYIQGCTRYKSVYTYTRLYIHRWNLYIWVYTHMSKYKIVYTLMNAVYLRTSPYIRVYMRMWHFAKTCMTRRFELGISCILQGCSDHYATSVDTKRCIVWYMSAKLRFISSLSLPGRLCQVANECHVILIWASLLYLILSHYAPSGSARSLRPYTCFRKCARAIKPDAKHIKMD